MIRSKTKLYMFTFVLVVIVGVGLIHGGQLLSMGASYKSKMLCSEVFVAGRDREEVLEELIIDDLSALKSINSIIDDHTKTVTSSFYGIVKSKVQFKDNAGCSVETTPNRKRPPQEVDSSLQSRADLIKPSTLNASRLSEIVSEAFSEPNTERLRRTRAVVILHKGQVIAERYAPGIDESTLLLGWSMTKSVVNALIGVLVQQERIKLETPVNHENWSNPDDPRSAITVHQMLTMTSGLKFNEEMSDPLADVSRMILQEPDMAKFAANMPLEEEPGSRWQYSSGNSILLSELMHRVLAADYHKFPQEALFTPLQMKGAIIETDAAGTFVGSSFMYATARDWAKIGQLYLQKGMWKGRHILPENWVQYSLTSVPENKKRDYGAHFWLDIPQAYKGDSNIELPKGIFHAVGHEGQFITVVPSHETVIVRFGKTRYSGTWEHDQFVNNVLSQIN